MKKQKRFLCAGFVALALVCAVGLMGASAVSATTTTAASASSTWPLIYGQAGSYAISDPQDLADMDALGLHLMIEYPNTVATSSFPANHAKYISVDIDSIVAHTLCPDGACSVNAGTLNSTLVQTQNYLDSVAHDPSVVGFWILDDYPGADIHAALEQVHALVAQANVTSAVMRPTVCGLGTNLILKGAQPTQNYSQTLANITPAACDMVGIYSYGPASVSTDPAQFDWSMSMLLPNLFTQLQQAGWDPATHPIIGLPQAFGVPGSYVTPRAADIAQQVSAFCNAGASAITAFSWNTSQVHDSAGLGGAQEPYNNFDIEQGLVQGVQQCKVVWHVVTPPAPTCTLTTLPLVVTKNAGASLEIGWNSQNAVSRAYKIYRSSSTSTPFFTSPFIPTEGFSEDVYFDNLAPDTYTRVDTVVGPGGTGTCSSTLTVLPATPVSAPLVVYSGMTGNTVNATYQNLPANTQLVVVNQTTGDLVPGLGGSVSGSSTISIANIPVGAFYLRAQDATSGEFIAQSVTFYGPDPVPTCTIAYSPSTIAKNAGNVLGIAWNSENALSRSYKLYDASSTLLYTSPQIAVGGTLQDTSFNNLAVGSYTRIDTVVGATGATSTCSATGTVTAPPSNTDAKRKQDLQTLASALGMYYQKHGTYYVANAGWNGGGLGVVSQDGAPQYNTIVQGLYADGDLASGANLPANPISGRDYYLLYICNAGQSYALSARLDNPTSADINNIQASCNGVGSNGTYTFYGRNYAVTGSQ